jgi:hypothetical protein
MPIQETLAERVPIGGVGKPWPYKPGKSSSGSSVATNSELHDGALALKLEHLGVRVDDDRLGLEGTCDCEFL